MNSVSRSPAVAGQFYPADPGELSSLLASLPFRHFSYLPIPKILLFPHAGLVYSGPIALTSASHWQNLASPTIILLGASHHYPFDFVALDPHPTWQTPLGKVSLDQKITRQLNQQSFIKPKPEPHLPEHSLELPLITLQHFLTNFKIIPLLLSNPSTSTLTHLAEVLADLLDQYPHLYLAISSDLSHYPPYSVANSLDFDLLSTLYDRHLTRFAQTINTLPPYPHLHTRACGHHPLTVALKIATLLDLNPIYLNYQNSGDRTQDYSQVVGYGAFGFAPLDHRQQALNLARFTLEYYLKTGEKPHLNHLPHPQLTQPQGTFVTLRTHPHHQLRGCIGNILPLNNQPAWQSLIDNTISAAVNDPRFSPLSLHELPQINLEISLLSPPQPISSPNQIKLGLHGVILRQGSRQAVFLPEVATEHHLTLEEFLSHLALKAGLPPHAWQDPTTRLAIFTTETLAET